MSVEADIFHMETGVLEILEEEGAAQAAELEKYLCGVLPPFQDLSPTESYYYDADCLSEALDNLESQKQIACDCDVWMLYE